MHTRFKFTFACMCVPLNWNLCLFVFSTRVRGSACELAFACKSVFFVCDVFAIMHVHVLFNSYFPNSVILFSLFLFLGKVVG